MNRGTACERFFAIPELISLSLHQLDTISLIRCQRVCLTWTNIVNRSEILQENLFLKAREPLDATDGTVQVEPVTLNPVLQTYFSPLLSFSRHETRSGDFALQSPSCTYADLTSLPWAQDGIHMGAPARVAFARSEASWRDMLVTQPPILRFHWYHGWDTDQCTERRYIDPDPELTLSGDGHGHSYDEAVTLGMLWDIMEARLLRGCTCQVTFFPSGSPVRDDPTASELEIRHSGSVPGRQYDARKPRIRLETRQSWSIEPSMYQMFDVQRGCWIGQDELPWTPSTDDECRQYLEWDGNGMVWLNEDCKRDSEASNGRWSRSDGASDTSMVLRDRGNGQNHHKDHIRRRERTRQALGRYGRTL